MNGVINWNWTSSDFTCDGPPVGADNQTGVTITATTMTWPDGGMTWTRPSGTAGDIIGTWTASDSTTGNSYTLTFNANGTMSLVGNIVQCGGSGAVNAYSQHWSSGYYAHFWVNNASHQYTSVTVTGPYILQTVPIILLIR